MKKEILSRTVVDMELLSDMETLNITGGTGINMPLSDIGCTNEKCINNGCKIGCTVDINATCQNIGCIREEIKTGGSGGCNS